MKAIVVVDANWGIGSSGKLLANIPGDLKYFKEKTSDKMVVMGRKTLESLPGGKPLVNRLNFILTHDPDYIEKHKEAMSQLLNSGSSETANVSSCQSISDLLWKLNEVIKRKQTPKTVFVIGGASVYSQLLEYIDVCLVTKIDAEFEADTWFPNLDTDPAFELYNESASHEENGYRYRFCEYRRKKNDAKNAAEQIDFLKETEAF
jgi:dihydrofolate reductase